MADLPGTSRRRAPGQRQQRFPTWAAGDGWINFQDVRTAKRPPPETAKAPTDAPDYYLTGPIEVVSTGSGVLICLRQPPARRTRYEVIGRADPDVARVSAIMPNGKVAWAPVENGMFIIDQVTQGLWVYHRSSPNAVRAYNRAGQLVYTLGHVAPTSQAGPVTCYVAPGGQAVNRPVPGQQSCRPAVAWD